ncbi:MAG TPA: hypothetical protein VF297_21725 [Pyrinomonadaceae bacterium]
MKHRSVIAFVIVAAALFSLPQLSHDLKALKGAVGARLHRELLHAFLNLPTGEPSAAAPVARAAEPLLASCPREKSGATWKASRAGASARAEVRTGGKDFEQNAMIGDPARDPINQGKHDEIKEVAEAFVASLSAVEAEVAMITPPSNSIEPPRAAPTAGGGARVDADRLRVEADGMRVAYATAVRFEANGTELRKALDEATRKLNASAPGAYEFRVVRDGAKTKVLKFKCNECPASAPRVTRLPRQVAVNIELPEPVAAVGTLGE